MPDPATAASPGAPAMSMPVASGDPVAGDALAVPSTSTTPAPSTPAPATSPPTTTPPPTTSLATTAPPSADAPAATDAIGGASDGEESPPAPGTKRAQLASAVADAVDAVGGVRRSGGPGVQLATQFAGGRVVGVAIKDELIEVHIVAERLPLTAIVADAHRAAVAAARSAGDGRPVDLTVDDLDVESLPPVGVR